MFGYTVAFTILSFKLDFEVSLFTLLVIDFFIESVYVIGLFFDESILFVVHVFALLQPLHSLGQFDLDVNNSLFDVIMVIVSALYIRVQIIDVFVTLL